MARNPFASIGAGLARGAGNYSQLMLANRLKREADARDLAGRQQLQSGQFAQQEKLFGLGQTAEDARFSRGQAAEESRFQRGQEAAARSAIAGLGGDPSGAKGIEELNAILSGLQGEERERVISRQEQSDALAIEEHTWQKAGAELRNRLAQAQIAAAEAVDPTMKFRMESLGKRAGIIAEQLDILADEVSGSRFGMDKKRGKEIQKEREALFSQLQMINEEWLKIGAPPTDPAPDGEDGSLDEALEEATRVNRGATGKF